MDFSVQPTNVAAHAVMSPAVVVSDASAKSVTISVVPATVTIGGTLTRPFVAGKATFDNLTFAQPGVGYTLVADHKVSKKFDVK